MVNIHDIKTETAECFGQLFFSRQTPGHRRFQEEKQRGHVAESGRTEESRCSTQWMSEAEAADEI